MGVAKYLAAFACLAIVPLGGWLGGGWSFLLVGVLPVGLVSLDAVLGDDAAPADATGLHRLLPWLYIPSQLAVTAWTGWVVAQPSTPWLESAGLTLAVGVASGVFGFITAHEMVHSGDRRETWLGVIMLAAMLNTRFAIAHVQGHHRRAATVDDPATARRGESVYGFIVRSALGQAREAWAFEARRLAAARFGPRNRLLAWGLIEVAMTGAFAALGWRALAFFLVQSALAIVLLESFNYIAHYGLRRREGPDGRLEPLRPWHSWNTRRRANNAALFNMGRHADHHRFSARPYPALEVLEGGAELPCGYAGVLLMAFLPPLFRRVMDPRADAAMARSVVSEAGAAPFPQQSAAAERVRQDAA